jgi:hypothetical protein
MGKWTRRLFSLVLGTLAVGPADAYVIPPEPLLDLGGGIEVVTGAWTATGSQWNTGRGPATLVQLSLRTGRSSEIRHSFARLVTDLAGLNPAAVLGAPRDVRFVLVRDAGALRFEGRFQAGAGSGRFTFVPSAPYLNAMRALGYPAIDAEDAYRLAALDVSREFVEELVALGHARLPLDILLALRIQGADPAFVRALRAEGYAGLAPEQLLSLRIHGVTPEFIRELSGLGYRSLPPADLVSLRIHGVTPEFARRVNASRVQPTSVSQLVDLRLRGREP